MSRITIDADAVRLAYRRWAPIYDLTFGRVAQVGRKQAVKLINRRKGRVLEVGVGTGLSLPYYASHLDVTGIDLSPEMLAKARTKAGNGVSAQIAGLFEMDAGALEFEDDAFDVVVAMYVMTVVPEPEKVMAELERVCAPGGEVILVNHFSQEDGARGWVERSMAPLAATLGWNPVFPVERIMTQSGLRPAERSSLWPMGLFTMMRFIKQPGYALQRKLEGGPAATPGALKPAEAGVSFKLRT